MQQLTAQERVARACVGCGRRRPHKATTCCERATQSTIKCGGAVTGAQSTRAGAVTGGSSLKHALAERGLVHLSAARVGRKLLDGRLVRLGLTVRVRSEHVIVE